MPDGNHDETFVYIGTYTRGASEGIYVYRLDPSSGSLSYAAKATGLQNPSFLALDPQRRYLYAVNEVAEFGGVPGGAVSAFSVDRTTGELAFLNQQSSRGASPCHLSVEGTGRFVLVANYTGGSVCVLPIGEDGRLGEATDVVQHRGSSVHPTQQNVPHAHSVTLDPANRYAFVADLGIDKIMVYRLDLNQGKLRPNNQPWVLVKAGAGPRHFTFHPNGRYAYVINELDSTVTAFSYDGTAGTLAELQTLSTLPAGFTGRNSSADVHVSPSGRFLYGSNRGHDSIVIFQIEESTGKLTCIAHEPTRGRTPRNFTIDPTGTFLLAANQNSDTIVTFRIDEKTGKLFATGHVAQVPQPVCLKVVVFS